MTGAMLTKKLCHCNTSTYEGTHGPLHKYVDILIVVVFEISTRFRGVQLWKP